MQIKIIMNEKILKEYYNIIFNSCNVIIRIIVNNVNNKELNPIIFQLYFQIAKF